jgi:hypothetical protein
MLTYESFRDKIEKVLKESGALTWTEIRTAADLPEKFSNISWVHRLERDIGLQRDKGARRTMKWSLR